MEIMKTPVPAQAPPTTAVAANLYGGQQYPNQYGTPSFGGYAQTPIQPPSYGQPAPQQEYNQYQQPAQTSMMQPLYGQPQAPVPAALGQPPPPQQQQQQPMYGLQQQQTVPTMQQPPSQYGYGQPTPPHQLQNPYGQPQGYTQQQGYY
jgi:hypothetical protein